MIIRRKAYIISMGFFLSFLFLSVCRILSYSHYPEEAAQPDAPIPRGIKTKTEGNGPQINVYSPSLDEPLRIPFIMDISFEASSDKTIDFDSLKIKYLKLVPIDLTGKIKPYLNNNRLIVKDVKVPQGKHRLQLFDRLCFRRKNNGGNCLECG